MPVPVVLPDGRVAALEPDAVRPECLVLTVDGAEQSLLDPHDPLALPLEYTARLGAVVDALGPPGEPLRVLHLGAGGLSLARYVAATRPGSEQVAVERAAGLVEFVLAHAPLPRGARVRLITGDAAAPLACGEVDLVVLDVYDGDEIPEPFYDPAVLARIAGHAGSTGLLAVNVADDADHRRLLRLRRALKGVLPVSAAVGPTAFVEGRTAGNAILLASRSGAASAAAARLLSAGPHPVAAAPDGDVVVPEVPVEVDP
jgi:spermidine synthase